MNSRYLVEEPQEQQEAPELRSCGEDEFDAAFFDFFEEVLGG